MATKKLYIKNYVIPDEVLMEILLRLPLLSLQLFKSVSKHWLSLITSEYFIRRLRKPRIDTPCGLFISKDNYINYDFVTLGPKVSSFPIRATIAEAGSYFRIMKSCNGLLLCNNFVSHQIYYYVYNPFTNIFKNIPISQFCFATITDMILAFDPTKSPYYKLVITQDWVEDRKQDWEEDSEEDTDTKEIVIYSSETGKCRIWGPPLHQDRFTGFSGGIYWNNAIHWINNYDGERLHSKFDIVDHPIVTNIQTPALDDVKNISLFESRGSLVLLMEDNDHCYHIFEMREESSEWSVKYIVDDIVNTIPDLYWSSHTYALCIVLGERGDDSYMVIESDNQIVRYNFVSKSVSTLSTSYDYWDCFPFIASLAGV